MIFLYSKTGSPKKSQSGSIPNPNHLKEVEEYVNNSLEEKLKDFVKRVSHFDIQKDVVLCWESKLDVLQIPHGIKNEQNEQNEKKDKKREYDRQNYLKKKKLNGTKLQKERNEKKDKKREYDKHNYLKKKKLKDTK